MSAWEDLVASTLIGTERRAVPLPDLSGAAGDLLRRAASGNPEETVFRTAAVLAVWQRAGRSLQSTAGSLPEPSPPETLRRCSPAAAAHLEVILVGQYRDALPEWLALAAATGLRAPTRLLPQLLDVGEGRPELRAPLLRVIGERGRWVAAQNPEWSYVADSEREQPDVWETGHHAARVAFLRRMRAQDSDRARELLESTWKTEAGERRADLVETLRTGLSLADESFLEAVLADRRKEARLAALDLLARLPDSGLVRRMTERVLARVRLRRVLLAESLEVTLPDGLDEGMLRDGIEVKPAPGTARMGEKAGWLAQMLGAVPPRVWETELRKSPRELVRLARKGDWAAPLLEGWSQAAVRHSDVGWAEAILLEQFLDGANEPLELVNLLPPGRLLPALQELGCEPDAEKRVLAALQPYTGPWTEELSRLFLEVLKRYVAATKQRDYSVHGLLQRAAYLLAPLTAAETDDGWPVDASHWRYWQDPLEGLQATLRFRRELRLSLTAKDV